MLYSVPPPYLLNNCIWCVPIVCLEFDEKDGIVNSEEEEVSCHSFVEEAQGLHFPDNLIRSMTRDRGNTAMGSEQG